MVAKVVTDLESPILIETEVVEEAEPKVVEDPEPKPEVEEPKPKVEEPLIETPVDLSAEPTINLLSFLYL